jgi:hypothetical protein
MTDTAARLIKGLKKIQDATRKREREDEEVALHAITKRAKDLENAVKSSDGDAALFYGLCADHKNDPAFDHVILPYITRTGDAEPENGGAQGHPGIHLHRLSAILLRMRSERMQDMIMGLKEEKQDLLSMVNTLETERVINEEKLKGLDNNITPPSANGSARLEEEVRTAVQRAQVAEDNAKKQGDKMAGAHQQRVHSMRVSATAALDNAHSKATAHMDSVLDTMVDMREEDKQALVASFASYMDDCRCVLGGNLI